MKELKNYKLSDLLEIKYGKDHKGLNEGSFPCFGTGGLMRKVEKFIYDKESILIPRKGTLTNLYYINEPFWTVDTLFWSKINEDLAFPKFLYYKLKILDLSNLDEGSAIPSLTTKTLNQIDISLPFLETQKKIANILSKYDDLIENNLKRIELLEEAAQRLYKEWFIDLRFPEYEKVKIENGIPEGWEKKKIKEIYEISSGKRPKIKLIEKTKEAQIPIIGASGIIAYTNEYLLNENTLTIGRVGTLGVVQRFDEPIWASDNTLLFKGKMNNYIEQFLNKVPYQSLNRGSSQPLITQGDMGNLEILDPSIEIIMKFENISGKFYSMKKTLQIQNQKLTEARDRLLPKLMKGEIEI